MKRRTLIVGALLAPFARLFRRSPALPPPGILAWLPDEAQYMGTARLELLACDENHYYPGMTEYIPGEDAIRDYCRGTRE